MQNVKIETRKPWNRLPGMNSKCFLVKQILSWITFIISWRTEVHDVQL